MIRTPYTRRFGVLYEKAPELDASPYQLFVIESRFFSTISKENDRLVCSFQTYTDDASMRLYIQIKEYGFDAGLTPEQVERYQTLYDEMFVEHPHHCLLYEGEDAERVVDLVDERHAPILQNGQVLVDLRDDGDDFMSVYLHYSNRIFYPEEDYVQGVPLSAFTQ